MTSPPPHRKRVRHYDEPEHVHLLVYPAAPTAMIENLIHRRRVMESIDYLHNNPVRRGLVESAISWRWSSLRRYTEKNPVEDPDLPVVHGLPPEFFDPRDL
jgi:hypothetical protein